MVKALLIRRCLTISPERGALVVTDPSPLLPPVGVNLTFGKFKQGSQPLLKVPFGITLEEAVWFLLNPGELREQAAQHRKAAREYRSLIKSIKEQDPHG